MHTDPIADLLTRIRNASRVSRLDVTCPSSVLKKRILDVLQAEGYIASYKEEQPSEARRVLAITLVRGRGILNIKRVSTPGRRVYITTQQIRKVLNGFGIAVISTPKGVMTGAQARKEKIGGELICELW